ncbi:type I restriction-modification system subunit M [Maridesulfovibrio hydrothermalis]|uniref:site-specific DNA-methyltransferase (adenine-specific) n=1 Tax=Maridesulfovibrio hydrothermalis AM13 = DSM 14728 TaxID=1121451 RepID=L0R7W4_9BACT|nr:class I SAM-dependent DNA methyltransferase [Maridesulfovibrio hydrothermalis]CCO22317.1 putative type I restriction-modification system (N6 DNA methylase) [Maridesulfovibrio hydrothermalis AM13 = DSM 14728]
MNYSIHNTITNFIWNIADDVLRDVYVRGKYRDVILPMTVIRRLDALLEPTKEAVLNMKKQLDSAGIANQDAALCQASGEAFFNSSPFTLKDLKNRAKVQQLKADFEAYLDGFSPNVQEILDKFKFRNQIPTLVEADILGALIEKYLNPSINLSPKPVLDADGTEKLPGLDNHGMGTVFEELIRRFNEENNEEAGEHFTPRDVVKLMADLIFLPIADKIESGTYLVYDGACGTGGMLTVAEERLQKLAKEAGKEVSIHLYGQEVQPETYAIAKADLLLKGEGAEAENIKYGSTLSADAFVSNQFDFMLSNPPYGKSWKTDLERMGGKSDLKDPRFILEYGDEPEYKMLTRSSDGQLMFLVNKLMKMKESSKLGSRIAQVHNGSSLFTGDAGQGESNIRRWIIENDWLEAIIALPENIFYNTGISTYIWVLTNRKADTRKGKVQLIYATDWYQSLRKNMGKKNCELNENHIQRICDLIMNPRETEQSKIFTNEAFGYQKVIVERPLRLSVPLIEKNMSQFERLCIKAKETALYSVVEAVAAEIGEGPHRNYNNFLKTIESQAKGMAVKLPAKSKNFLKANLAVVDEFAEPVIKKIHKTGKAEPNPLYGLYDRTIDGKKIVVEYEPDTNLRDSEQVPLLEDGGIAAFIEREVQPYTPDAWIDASKTQIGYEISFTKHFYKPIPMRTLDEIKADIFAIEQETEGLLEEIIGEAE